MGQYGITIEGAFPLCRILRLAGGGRTRGASSCAGERPLKCANVEPRHPQHGLEDPLARGVFGIASEPLQPSFRHDLPTDAEAVLQPAALAGFAALGEFGPVAIHFRLARAEDLQRHSRKSRPAWDAAARCTAPQPVTRHSRHCTSGRCRAESSGFKSSEWRSIAGVASAPVAATRHTMRRSSRTHRYSPTRRIGALRPVEGVQFVHHQIA